MLMPSIFGDTFMDNFFDNTSRNSYANSFANGLSSTSIMKTDIKETPDAYELGIELPGYTKDDVEAELKNGYLIVTAKRESSKDNSKENTEDKKPSYIHRERYYGSCRRSYYVGKAVKEDDIQARFENGILYLDIPKKVEKPVEEKRFIRIAG